MQKRAFWLAIVTGLLAVAAFSLYRNGPSGMSWFPGCLFRKFTGLNCPGCGMTRATHAAMHGDLARAFRFNPLGMILLPIAMVGVGQEIAGWVRGRPLPWRLHVGAKGGWAILSIILAFWILRNLPWWPCTLLAPP